MQETKIVANKIKLKSLNVSMFAVWFTKVKCDAISKRLIFLYSTVGSSGKPRDEYIFTNQMAIRPFIFHVLSSIDSVSS
jgi:hypothetical protein